MVHLKITGKGDGPELGKPIIWIFVQLWGVVSVIFVMIRDFLASMRVLGNVLHFLWISPFSPFFSFQNSTSVNAEKIEWLSLLLG